MNGRLYDPILARVLSPDPALQLPANTQNYNRYSYCLNNPLKYNDPSGNIMALPTEYRQLGVSRPHYRINDITDNNPAGWGGNNGVLPAGSDGGGGRDCGWTWVEGIVASGWVRNSDIINVNPNNVKVFSKNDEATALIYMVGLAILSNREVIGFYSTEGIIILPTTGKAVRNGSFNYGGETQNIKIGTKYENAADAAGWSEYFVDIKTRDGKSTLTLNGETFNLSAYIHTHPVDPKDNFIFDHENGYRYEHEMGWGDRDFSEKLKIPALCLELELNRIFIGFDNENKSAYLTNPKNGGQFTISEYIDYSRLHGSLIYKEISKYQYGVGN